MRKLRWKNHLAQSHQASKLEQKPWFLCCQSPVFLTGRSPGVQVPGPLGESSSIWGWSGCSWVRETLLLWRVQGWDPITRKLGTDYRLLWGGSREMMVFCSLFHFLPGHPESSLRSISFDCWPVKLVPLPLPLRGQGEMQGKIQALYSETYLTAILLGLGFFSFQDPRSVLTMGVSGKVVGFCGWWSQGRIPSGGVCVHPWGGAPACVREV